MSFMSTAFFLLTLLSGDPSASASSQKKTCQNLFRRVTPYGLLSHRDSFTFTGGQILHSAKALHRSYQKEVYQARLDSHPVLLSLYRHFSPRLNTLRASLQTLWSGPFEALTPHHSFIRRERLGLSFPIDQHIEPAGLSELGKLRPLPLQNTSEVLAAAEALYRGVDALVESGFVHTDLSHSNIVFFGPEKASLASGYAHLAISDLDSLVPTGSAEPTLSGTAPYFSPAQLEAIYKRRLYFASPKDMYWQVSTLLIALRFGPSHLRRGSIREHLNSTPTWIETTRALLQNHAAHDPLISVLTHYIENGWSEDPLPLELRSLAPHVLDSEYEARVERLHEERHHRFQRLLSL